MASTATVLWRSSLTRSTSFCPCSTRTLTAVVLSCTSMPSRAKASDRICAASRSSRGRNSGRSCAMMVSAPKRQNACASSQPSGPPPMTSRRRGNSVRSKTFSLVRKPASARPGIEGVSGRAPVAISAFLKRSRAPSAVSASAPVKHAWPKNTSTPAAVSRRTESARLMRARIPRMRSISAGKSTRISAGVRAPYCSAWRISAYRRDVRMIDFDGTQPTFRQSPPNRPRSINATFAPSAAAACAAAALGAKVALIERGLFGGDCLNVGCVPSKSIIRTSRLYAEMRHAEQYGAQTPADIRVDFAAVMERMRGIRARISRADAVRRLTAAGVDVFFGQACFTGTDALTVGGARLRFKKALIATGARPDTPSIPGLAEAGYLTNENVFDLTELPRRLLVIGGGPLGCELAQAFCRCGAQTIITQDMPLFLPREERDAAQILSDSFARDGIDVQLNTKAVGVRVEHGQKLVDLVSDDRRSTVAVDAILTGTGRVPEVGGLGLEAAGVAYDDTD